MTDTVAAPVAALVDEAARLLPTQAPLPAFVHHNTLHAFAHLPFDEAVAEAAEVLGGEPYLSEEEFAALRATGKITSEDLAAVTADAGDDPVVPGGPTRRDFLRLRLGHPVEVPEGAALDWLLEETAARTRLDPGVPPARLARLAHDAARALPGAGAAAARQELLALLWDRLAAVAPPAAAGAPPAVRRRDQLRERTGVDTDEIVHPLLIRFCAAYLDQGVAHWPMPGREAGLLTAFRDLYGGPARATPRALRALPPLLARQRAQDWSAERTVDWALDALGVPPAGRRAAVEATLLSLRGWAGMVRQLERRPVDAPVAAPPARLVDYLAVQLTLDLVAARHVLRRHLSPTASMSTLDDHPDPPPPAAADLPLVYEAFVLAQRLPVDLDTFADPAHARAWLRAVADADALTRRRLWQAAYERRHQCEVLDALRAHAAHPPPRPHAAAFQAVFCIDEREESLRRHLEEVCPDAETLGYAGFFGVPMAYQGATDVRPRPLCPVVVTPRHVVTEEPRGDARRARRRRSRFGALHHGYDTGSRTLLRGAALSLGAGLGHLLPLIGRCLFPRVFHRAVDRLARGPRLGPTRLALEFRGSTAAGDRRGFTVAEMADIVAAALRTTGLAGRLAPLVLLVGHGSASLNNPHEAAHDCGATGGGRGGPNARALAAMANDPRVRAVLAARGLPVPDAAWCVGAYHNTCDDTVRYYDLDLVPAHAGAVLGRARTAVAEALRRAAHERCRRFADAGPALPAHRALAVAQAHTVDLGQPRPEYGHATNAVCVVGRRSRTRGLFLDRRAFLVSYDPAGDGDGAVLAGLLGAVGPVCAGINLEYYFSRVDPVIYGCGTKLPHNVTGLLGVMDGHASDLRTGLPWQMVEIHEPVRLLLVVEAPPHRLAAAVAADAGLAALVRNRWIRLAAWHPDDGTLSVYGGAGFTPHVPQRTWLPVAATSAHVYAGRTGPLPPVRVRAGAPPPPPDGAVPRDEEDGPGPVAGTDGTPGADRAARDDRGCADPGDGAARAVGTAPAIGTDGAAGGVR